MFVSVNNFFMKQALIVLSSLLLFILSSCHEKQKINKTVEVKTINQSLIEGNWETVSFEANGKIKKSKRSLQEFKMFHDGFFLFFILIPEIQVRFLPKNFNKTISYSLIKNN